MSGATAKPVRSLMSVMIAEVPFSLFAAARNSVQVSQNTTRAAPLTASLTRPRASASNISASMIRVTHPHLLRALRMEGFLRTETPKRFEAMRQAQEFLSTLCMGAATAPSTVSACPLFDSVSSNYLGMKKNCVNALVSGRKQDRLNLRAANL